MSKTKTKPSIRSSKTFVKKNVGTQSTLLNDFTLFTLFLIFNYIPMTSLVLAFKDFPSILVSSAVIGKGYTILNAFSLTLDVFKLL